MKRKIILLICIMTFNYLFSVSNLGIISSQKRITNDMCQVYAQGQEVQYIYDSLGRVSSVRYPDGIEIKYEYDANGNLLSSKRIKKQENTNGSNGNHQTNNNHQNGSMNKNSGYHFIPQKQIKLNVSNITLNDVKSYNLFKKRKPVIKSLKKNKSKKQYYLKIQIKQVNKRGIYGETGYQIKYAANQKFKKAKTIKITRTKKGLITSKKWKVKKRKIYYVKVRAFMKTGTGKMIYSKYSKTKKIQIK